MSGAFGQDRTPREDVRPRRNSQRWSSDFEIVAPGGGLLINPDGTLAVSVSGPIIITAGALTLDPGDGLAIVSDQIVIDLATDSGLAFTGGDLAVSLAANSGLTTVGGLQLTEPEGRFEITTVKTGAYTAAWGECVRCDPSGGAFTVTLPTAVGNDGRQIIVKNTTDDATAITIDGNSSETIDGSATVVLVAGRSSLTLMSDGTNVMIV